GDARIVEIGCGTGQMSLYLTRADRLVIGADLTRASLLLGQGAARRFGLARVQFVETDLRRPGLRAGAFDVVYASGVLHHTPNPRASFARIAALARPGGIIVVGLYNAFARIPLRLRRFVARLSGYRWIPFDPVLRERDDEPARRGAWAGGTATSCRSSPSNTPPWLRRSRRCAGSLPWSVPRSCSSSAARSPPS